MKPTRHILPICLVALMLTACSYGIRQEPVIGEVAIAMLDNRTNEPALGDLLRVELTKQLMARGVKVNDAAPREIHGTMKSITLTPLATKAGVDVKYSVTMEADFSLSPRDVDGEALKLDTSLSFMIAFGADYSLDLLYAGRTAALRQAMAELATDLARAVAYTK